MPQLPISKSTPPHSVVPFLFKEFLSPHVKIKKPRKYGIY